MMFLLIRNVFYNSINKDTLKGILEIQLNVMATRVKDKGLDIQFSEEELDRVKNTIYINEIYNNKCLQKNAKIFSKNIINKYDYETIIKNIKFIT